MTTKNSGGPPVRGTAAPRTYPRQEVGRRFDGIPPRRPPADVTALGRQYLNDQRELHFEQALTGAERFERFHAATPQVYDLLVEACREWKVARPGKKLGVRLVWERMRWQLAIATDAHDFKLNDHYTSFYARLIEHQEPDLAGLFELRRSPEADQWIKRVAS